MSDWTIIIRTALASLIGMLSLAASFCMDADDSSDQPTPVITATVTDQPVRAQVDDVTDDVAEKEPVFPASPVHARVSNAIQEVRRSHGSMLEGTALQQPENAAANVEDFSSALRRVARESEIAPADPLPLASPSPGFMLSSELSGSVLMRQAARELEMRAADNEDLRQFEDADHLRRLSTDLRREARRWDERSQLTGSAP